MIEAHKFIIGIRPAVRMFRLSTVGGQIIDNILAERGKGILSNEYYTQVTSQKDLDRYQLRNPENGNSLKIDQDNVIFYKDSFDQDFQLDIDQCIKEFYAIWKIVNGTLNMREIRRIGIAAEHHLEGESPNNILIRQLTKFQVPPHAAKFHLKFEERKPTLESLAPDINKADFVNVSSEYYDSEIDSDHPETGLVNLNIDVQRYYFPHLAQISKSDIDKHIKTFQKERKQYFERLTSLEMMASE